MAGADPTSSRGRSWLIFLIKLARTSFCLDEDLYLALVPISLGENGTSSDDQYHVRQLFPCTSGKDIYFFLVNLASVSNRVLDMEVTQLVLTSVSLLHVTLQVFHKLSSSDYNLGSCIWWIGSIYFIVPVSQWVLNECHCLCCFPHFFISAPFLLDFKKP